MNWPFIPHEPDIAYTDFLLTLEALLFWWMVSRMSTSHRGLAASVKAFWLSLAAAALLGGIFHGWTPFLGDIMIPLWKVVMLLVGLSSIFLLHVGLDLWNPYQPPGRAILQARIASWLLYTLYAGVIILITSCYTLAIALNIPAILVMGAALARMALHPERSGPGREGLAGLAIVVSGALIQLLRIGFPEIGLTYNAVYHIVTALGLVFIHRSLVRILRDDPAS